METLTKRLNLISEGIGAEWLDAAVRKTLGTEHDIAKKIEKHDPTGLVKTFVSPETKGYAKPGVKDAILKVLGPAKYADILDRGAGIGAARGAGGGLAAGLGTGLAAGASELFKGGGTLHSRLARAGLRGLGSALALAPLGAASGAVSGYMGGRHAGAGILGGGAVAGPTTLALSLAGVPMPIAAGIGAGTGYLAGGAYSDLQKAVHDARKGLVGGGGMGLLPNSPVARRIGTF
jgi:hypothetical protein